MEHCPCSGAAGPRQEASQAHGPQLQRVPNEICPKGSVPQPPAGRLPTWAPRTGSASCSVHDLPGKMAKSCPLRDVAGCLVPLDQAWQAGL
jgi:hypothetical protein